MSDDRRLIEDYLPIEKISEEASREKSVRKGHISTLHLWWARRPLVACRAAVYGALVPLSRFRPANGPEEKRDSLTRANAAKFVERLCKYPGDLNVIAEAQRHILEAHAERLTRETGKPVTVDDIVEGRAPRPKVLDMFAGGGSIPLEALRLGCEAYAVELNPVAHIIELCTLVYPQKYGRPDKNAKGSAKDGTWAGLAEEVRYWGKWVLEKVRAEIGDLYPPIPDPQYQDGGTGFPACAQQELFTTRRNLPHWQLRGSTYFVTFRLREGTLGDEERDAVLNAIKHFEGQRQEVLAAVVMPDHAHALLRPLPRAAGADWLLGNLLKSIKGFSAREINKRRGCHGPLWQDESFDRIVRDEAELLEKWNYIRNNPVKRGLASTPDEYRWLWQTASTGIPGCADGVQTGAGQTGGAQAGKPVPPDQVPRGYLTPVAYLWTRTVRCKNPACGATVPLVRQTWLCKKKGRYVALKMVAPAGEKRVRFEVVEGVDETDLGFDPGSFSKGGNATCPWCGTVADTEHIKSEGCAARVGQQMMAVACSQSGRDGKVYVSADDSSVIVPDDEEIRQRTRTLCSDTGLTVPREPMPVAGTLGFRVQPYGIRNWGDLFTPRQMMALLSFAGGVRAAEVEMRGRGYGADRTRAVATSLGCALDKQADFNSSLCVLKAGGGRGVVHTFGRQALPMVWDFAEANPFNEEIACWKSSLNEVVVNIRSLAAEGTVEVLRGSALDLPWPTGTLDGVITDPPYYDNVPYADLSDFFYVWLKRTVGHLYPEHFAAETTPKKNEIVAESVRHGGNKQAARRAYEGMMARAFAKASQVLKPGGALVAVYAHKTTLGWATLVEALRTAEFVVTEAWPLDTETTGRLRAQESAALASSIFLVGRKRDGADIGSYEDQVRPELDRIVRERVATLWEMGIAGGDLIIAAVGAGLRAFTRFAKVEYANGEEVPAERFLAEVEGVVLETLLEKIFGVPRSGVAAVDGPTRFYVLWRYTYKAAELDAGEAIVFTYGQPVELDGRDGLSSGPRPLVQKKKGKYRLLDFTERGGDVRLGLTGAQAGGAQAGMPVPPDGAGSQPVLAQASVAQASVAQASVAQASVAQASVAQASVAQASVAQASVAQAFQPVPLIDVLHRILWLIENEPRNLNTFLDAVQPDRERLRLVAQTLAGAGLSGRQEPGAIVTTTPAEQSALGKLLANWRALVEQRLIAAETPLFGRPRAQAPSPSGRGSG